MGRSSDSVAASPRRSDRLRSALTGSNSPDPVSETQNHCPACPGQLKEVVLGPVHVDYCIKCHGVFLDKGELDEAVSAVSGSDPPPGAHAGRREYRSDLSVTGEHPLRAC